MKLGIAVILSIFTITTLSAQSVWKQVDESFIVNKQNKTREIVPDAYATFALDFNKLKKGLAKAGIENSSAKSKTIEIDLPMPNGDLETFEFVESPIMHPDLAAKFPQIKSYRGVSKTNKLIQTRLDFGTMGFHAVIFSPEGTIYIDPYFFETDGNYISYYTKNHHLEEDHNYSTTCGVKGSDFEEIHLKMENFKPSEFYKSAGDPVIKRTFRLAVATTGEWGQLYGSVENILSRIVTGVNRINMIFENEMATRFELISRNDEIVFNDPDTDPYENASSGGSLLGQNAAAINNIIGSATYDIGHIFTIRCFDVGGVANPGVVCLGNKANGVSCVGQANIAAFMVNTTAHEIGHQLSGGHSWNNCPNAQQQRSGSTAYEPGSGSTILSYAGTCGSQNIIGTNEDYFHVGNLEQFMTFIEFTGRCANEEMTSNRTPDVDAGIGDGLFIPISTPFELEGEATDEDGDALTYRWEQMDTGPASSLGSPEGNSASFRSFRPTQSAHRIFPRLSSIPTGGSSSEVLPTYSRDLTFRFTVADNHPGAGMTVWDEIQFKSVIEAGPFIVTSPNSVTFTEVGSTLSVEWDVANTDKAPVNCQNVDIYFSSDNGQNFDILLLEDAPNNGSAEVVMPNILTNEGKIKVKASNNIFFQLNRSNIIIREPSAPGFFIDINESEYDICLPDELEIEVIGTSFLEFTEPVTLEVSNNLPEGVVIDFSENPMSPDANSMMIINLDNLVQTQSFEINLMGIAENADTVSQVIKINATGTNFDDLELLNPLVNEDRINQTPIFTWSNAFNADNYTLEISTEPTFTGIVLTEAFLPDTSFLPNIIFENSSLYYWRVKANNGCIEYPSKINTFGTIGLSCKEYEAENLPRNISFSGNIEVEGVAKVFDVGEVADVNINRITGQHSNVLQLTGTLISPQGTELNLFENTCFASTDFNIGFDDQSPLDFSCPLSSGVVVKPQEGELSVFNGENIEGDWTFRVEDNQSGDGGQFTSFTLELCASFEVNDPFVVNNNTLESPIGLSTVIRNSELFVDDNDNFAEELIFTVVSLPINGDLSRAGNILAVGDQFTQEDLNNELIIYTHTGSENEEDNFNFTVIDGQGGLLNVTTFNINIDEDFVSSNEEILTNSNFSIYPNPTSDRIFIKDNDKSFDGWNINIFDLNGRLVLSDQMRTFKSVSVQDFNSGIYILKLSNATGSTSMKVHVIK